MTSKTLLRGGCVLTLGARTQNFTEADVLMEDDRVAEVGTGIRSRGSEVIDATDTIVMPGFVDTHRHAWRSLFRNFGDGAGTGVPGLDPSIYGPHYQPEDVYAATVIGLLGALESGITTVVDWSDVHADDDFTMAARQAHADSGLRTVLVHSPPGWIPEGGDSDQTASITSLRSRTPDLSTMALGSADPIPSELDRIAETWASARRAGIRVHVHAGMDLASRGLIAELGDRGVLSDNVTLVHCSHLDDSDLDAVATHRAGVSLTPSSEMADGLGPPPVQQLIDRGIRPGLGIGSERLAPGDMFAQMRATNSIQHATMFDLKLAGKAGLPTLLSTRDVIRYATIDGMQAVGLGDVAGSIEVGKRADIIVLRADRPNIAPINDPIGAVVWGMDTSNLDWVFVDGRAVMSAGSLTADVNQARGLAIASQRRVAGAAGLLAGTGGPM